MFEAPTLQSGAVCSHAATDNRGGPVTRDLRFQFSETPAKK